jgi:hypothetical protein
MPGGSLLPDATRVLEHFHYRQHFIRGLSEILGEANTSRLCQRRPQDSPSSQWSHSARATHQSLASAGWDGGSLLPDATRVLEHSHYRQHFIRGLSEIRGEANASRLCQRRPQDSPSSQWSHSARATHRQLWQSQATAFSLQSPVF